MKSAAKFLFSAFVAVSAACQTACTRINPSSTPLMFHQKVAPGGEEMPNQVVVEFQALPPQATMQQFAAANGLRYLSANRLGSVLFQHDGRLSNQQLSQRLATNPGVVNAHPNLRLQRFFTVNDPRSSEQNGLAMIGASKAWDLTLGDPRVVIAIVDSGVDLNHPDLKANLVPGYNAITDGQTPPQDDNGHGTHAAGIAAAVGDNRIGVTGACPRCKIMPVKALDAQGGGGDGFNVAKGIIWAVDHGASVINLSLGAPKQELTLKQAVKYALSHNVPVVAAAGNGVETQTANGIEMVGADELNYPAAEPGVIAVGAVNFNRERTKFSNFGNWVSVMAPGSGILSTMPTSPVYMTTDEGYRTEYDTMDGTSMATPMVAGVIGLLRSRHPELTPAQIKARLEGTTIDLGAPGFDPDYANGMIDAYRAII